MSDDLAAAEALVETGDIEGARALGERLLEADATNAGAHNLLGFLAHREGRLVEAQLEFEHACALDPDDADARANLDAVRSELGVLYGASAPPSELAAPTQEFGGSIDELHAGNYGPDLSSRLLGRLLASGLPAGVDARLRQLPGATTVDERRFLCRFTSRLWDGRGDVFENGPMFGGTTRALALGMLANPHRTPGALLQTFDWFYYGSDTDASGVSFEAMIQAGLISSAQKREMEANRSFKAVFDSLHSGQDYSPLVRAHVAYLPGSPGDVAKTGDPAFELPEGRRFSLVFIDGCKSWYGTRYCFERLAPVIEPGSHLVFQDYGWYTCFWLPTFIGALGEHFRLVAHVDDTYAFQLLAPLDADTVRERFPEHPKDFGRDAFDELFMHKLIDAGERSDVHSIVSLTIQHAGALAYIGHTDEAREHIAAMLGRAELFPYRRRFIEPALHSPTYTPEGQVFL
jgi:tetratricopeptide (TPR) repeat protein